CSTLSLKRNIRLGALVIAKRTHFLMSSPCRLMASSIFLLIIFSSSIVLTATLHPMVPQDDAVPNRLCGRALTGWAARICNECPSQRATITDTTRDQKGLAQECCTKGACSRALVQQMCC
ncbi:hypothetical protein PENTCL1PPCAC_191, partial [Pristionchus entomophagus]